MEQYNQSINNIYTLKEGLMTESGQKFRTIFEFVVTAKKVKLIKMCIHETHSKVRVHGNLSDT